MYLPETYGLGGLTDWLLHPVETIRRQLAAFMALPSKWAQWRQTAEAYRTRGATPQLRAAAAELLELLNALQAKWNRARAMMRLDSSVGAVPVLFVGVVAGVSVVTLVTLLWAIFSGDNGAGEVLELLEQGALTPEQARDVLEELDKLDPGGPLSRLSGELASVLKVGAGALALWIALDAYQTRGRRR